MRQFLEAFAPLEHQVLEEVREPGAPLRLGAETHVVVHADADHRRGGVGREHDTQTVVEGVSDEDGIGHDPTLRRVCGKRCSNPDYDFQHAGPARPGEGSREDGREGCYLSR